LYIYGLIDVRDNSIRYIGRTKNVFARLGQHLLDEGEPTPKGAWLTELRQLGLYPKLKVLEKVSASENINQVAKERERYWIQKLRSKGIILVNSHLNKDVEDSASTALPPRKHILSPEKLYSLRRDLGWTQLELARQARLNPNTVRKAESGEPVSGPTASAIAEAFSKAFGKQILVRDIEGLNVSL
jgi:DNA-binding XRE family transcriptional regulator